MNNYEKIKNMTLDEMAEWLCANTCNYCIYHNSNDKNNKLPLYRCLSTKYCKYGVKQWLQAESEG